MDFKNQAISNQSRRHAYETFVTFYDMSLTYLNNSLYLWNYKNLKKKIKCCLYFVQEL